MSARTGGVICKGFTVSSVSNDKVQKWKIPGIKIGPDGIIRSRQCKSTATRRAPICVACRNSQDLLSQLLENASSSSEDSDNAENPVSQQKTMSADDDVDSEYDDSASDYSFDESNLITQSTKSKDSSAANTKKSSPHLMSTRRSIKLIRLPNINDPAQVIRLDDVDLDSDGAQAGDKDTDRVHHVVEEIIDSVAANRGNAAETKRKPGETAVSRDSQVQRRRRRRRVSSTSSDEFTKPKKQRWPLVGATKECNDAIVSHCNHLITKAILLSEQSTTRSRLLECQLCKKGIVCMDKNGGTAPSRLKQHALTHMASPGKRFYRCVVCDERKTLAKHLRLHIILRHHEATVGNWMDYAMDETVQDENRQSITDSIDKCFDCATFLHVSNVVRNEVDGNSNEKSAPTSAASANDPVHDYCFRIIRTRQFNGQVKCYLCKNASVNVSSYVSPSTVVQRMKTHAFLHLGKKFYKCRLCSFTAVTYVLMTRHVNSTHGKSTGGSKFDDLSLLEENQAVVIKALERCFEIEPAVRDFLPSNRETAEAAATIQQEAVTTEPVAAAYVYLLPNGELVLPNELGQGHGETLQLDGTFQNVDRIAPGCIFTLNQEEALEEINVTVLNQGIAGR